MTALTAYRSADPGECCHCRLETRTAWQHPDGHRVTHACCVAHLTAEYPEHTAADVAPVAHFVGNEEH